MKRLILFLLLTLGTTTLFAQAESKIRYIADTDKYVVTTPKSLIYELPGRPVFYSWRLHYMGETRYVVDYLDYKTKSLKKPQTLLVRGFANRHRQLNYDTYAVEYKGRLYFLPCESVADNSLLDSTNAALVAEHQRLTQMQADTRAELDSLILHTTNECKQQIAHHQGLKESLPLVIDSVKNKAKADYKALEKAWIDKWYNTLPQSTKNAFKKIAITTAELSKPNSAAGCDYTFNYVNNSNKTIKYLFWEGTFYNAVNDIVSCEIRNYHTFRGKDTGPVAPGESGGGVWDCVIYNWSADYVKLSSVSIIYMDGSKTSIGAGDIKRLTTMPSQWDFWNEYGTEYEAVTKATQSYEIQLYECDTKINMWKERLDYMQRGDYQYPLAYHAELRATFSRISQLYNNYNSVGQILTKFEKTNFLLQ